MVRDTTQTPEVREEQPQVIKTEINLTLINNKLNYLIGEVEKLIKG